MQDGKEGIAMKNTADKSHEKKEFHIKPEYSDEMADFVKRVSVRIFNFSKTTKTHEPDKGMTKKEAGFDLRIFINDSEKNAYVITPSQFFRNHRAMVILAKTGVPVNAFDSLSKAFDVREDELAHAVCIARRTLARRKSKDEQFTLVESERILRLASLFQKASEVFESEEKARRWFKNPKRALGGNTPLDYADTEFGAREVEDLLNRIDHGVYS